jgi:hypothetical protein
LEVNYKQKTLSITKIDEMFMFRWVEVEKDRNPILNDPRWMNRISQDSIDRSLYPETSFEPGKR